MGLAPSWTKRHDDVVEVTRAHELEGVVFKRLDSTYRPGRRSTDWRKLKHRRRETLPVTAWTPSEIASDIFYLARIDATGEAIPAGGVELGLSHNDRLRLRAALTERELPRARRRRVRAVAAGVRIVVESHGRHGRTPTRRSHPSGPGR